METLAKANMEAIVRELAESETTTGDDDGSRYCVLCGSRAQAKTSCVGGKIVLQVGSVQHADTCLWLRARKMTHG